VQVRLHAFRQPKVPALLSMMPLDGCAVACRRQHGYRLGRCNRLPCPPPMKGLGYAVARDCAPIVPRELFRVMELESTPTRRRA
jgi:hypothetical protein